jgi:hypothetical protein
MTNIDLARSYLLKARSRLKTLPILLQDEDFSDVVREAQEIVELATKAMLRRVGIDPPKWHDVSGIILENRSRFPEQFRQSLQHIVTISKALRKERELSFYGEVDFIPTEEYSREQGEKAILDAREVVAITEKLIEFTNQ